ncbi:uncharacterized protein LOC144113190 isoform X2 [Amblyomma americanum]
MMERKRLEAELPRLEEEIKTHISRHTSVEDEQFFTEWAEDFLKHLSSQHEAYNLEDRERQERLVQRCRLPLMRREFLLSKVSDEPLVRTSKESKDLLIEAMRYHLTPLPPLSGWVMNRTDIREQGHCTTSSRLACFLAMMFPAAPRDADTHA